MVAGVGGSAKASVAQNSPPAEPVVVEARFHADLQPTDGSAVVTLAYRLDRAPAAGTVAIRVLDFAPAVATRVRAGGAEVTWGDAMGAARTATVVVDEAPFGQGAEVTLSYRVAEALQIEGASVRVRIPVPALLLAPEGARPRLFQATVAGPTAWRMNDGFPSGVGPGAEAGSWEAVLPAVPSVVTLRGRTDGRWRPGLAVTLDGVALLVLVGFLGGGWRHMRGRA